MTIERYWMGKDLDLDELWADFDSGSPYVRKAESVPLHLLRLTFAGHPEHLPLFDFEVLFKTVKGTFHDVKLECLTPNQYQLFAPIFLHRVDRGSGIFEFLAELQPLVTWTVAVGGAHAFLRKRFSDEQELDEKRLAFLRKNFPNASQTDQIAYMKAWNTFGRRRALHRLLGQQLTTVEISQSTHAASRSPHMISMDEVLGTEHGGS